MQGIVSTWAPAAAGNNTQAYVQDVASRLGVSPNQPLNMQDPNVKAALARAISIHENGRAAVDSTAQGIRGSQSQAQQQQKQQTAQAVDQAVAQPSPVDKLNARADSGVTHTLPELQQTSTAQDNAIKWYRQAADKLRQQGNMAGYLDLNAKADKLYQQQLDNKGAVIKAQNLNFKEIGDDLHGSTDQKSYDAAIDTMRQNPDVYKAYLAMHPTGDYTQDRGIIETMKFKGEGLAQVQENENKKATLTLNQQKLDFAERKAQTTAAVQNGTYVPTDYEMGNAGQSIAQDPRFASLTPEQQTYAQAAVAKTIKALQIANPSLSAAKAGTMAVQSITPEQVVSRSLDSAGAPAAPVNPVDIARLENGELITSIIPSRGKDAYAQRSALFNAAVSDKMAKSPGMDMQTAVDEVNMSHGNQVAKGKSVGQLTTMYNNASIAMGRMDNNQRLAEDALSHLQSTDLAPVLNAVARKEQKFVGNPYQTQLFNAINGFADENAKFIVGGFTGSGATSDASRNQSLAMFNTDMTPAQLRAAFRVSNSDAQMTLTTIGGRLGAMGGTTVPAGNAAAPAGNAAAANTAPAGGKDYSNLWGG
ncbi:hypothetical protein PQR71_14035 [Paraburkholderia fungorum]|uniref:hypothetical protein n=1 Tax=Paraburkholderia fungorum TaxID=134537 RepID=UPI0038B9524B